MNKDQILENARKKKQPKEEYETHLQLKAARINMLVGALLATTVVLIDTFLLNTDIIGLTALIVFCGMLGPYCYITAIGTKKLLNWIAAICSTAGLISSVIKLIQHFL